MEITTKDVEEITVVCLRGEIKSTTSGEVMDSLVNLVKGGATKLLLNLQDVEFISSAGLRSILVASKMLKNSGGEIKICNANDSVEKVLQTSGFNTLVSIYASEDEAMAAFC